MKFLTIVISSLFLFACGKTGHLTTKSDCDCDKDSKVHTIKLSKKVNDKASKTAVNYNTGKTAVNYNTGIDARNTVVYTEAKIQTPSFDTGIRPTNSK